MPRKKESHGRIPYFDDFVSFYEQSPLSFSAADIFCCGPRQSHKRVAALVNILIMMRDQNKRFPISRIVVVFPGTFDEVVLKREEADLRAAVRDVMTQLRGQEATALQTDFLRRLLRVQRCTNLEVDAATSLVADAERYSVFIFVDAAVYRQEGLVIAGPTNGSLTMISEDLWVPHVHAFAERSVAAAGKKSCYVALDVGETSPYKPRNAEMLRDVVGCGVLGSRIVDDPREIVVARLEDWARQIQEGLLGATFSEIDGLPPSLDSEKRLLKIQVLSRAGLHAHMLGFLRQEVQGITETDPEVLVQFSRYAETAGDSELASHFLAPVIPELTSQEYLELASSVSSDIGNTVLEDTCLRRLETLFPNSHHLHQRRFTKLIDSRMYVEAAAILSNPIPGFSAELADFYKELVSALRSTSQPNYKETLARIELRWPTLIDRGRLICAADARARGLTIEALRILLTGGGVSGRIAASVLQSIEQVFIQRFSEEELETNDDLLREAISHLVRYSSRNPDDSGIRGGLSTILSPPISGTSGLFLIATAALELSKQDTATRRNQVRQDRPSVELSDLPKYVEPIMKWMSQQSPIAIGRCVLPKELLAAPADSLVGPLERLLQGQAGKLVDDGESNIFEMLLFAAMLIARHSSSPDDDLSLLRLGASKLALAGRVQRARDLLEEALQMTREKPHRARLAWYSFADVYQRLQNPVEALMGMACTLACKAEITTEQAWYETYLLIRLLRDVHLTEIAKSLLPVGQSLVQELGPEGEYQHRFATLELSVRLVELLDNPTGRETEVQDFVSDAEKLCTAVLGRNDEIAPGATLLAEGLHLCRLMKISLRKDISATLELVLAKTGEPLSTIVRILTVETPDAAAVLNLARKLEPARYASDMGFDLHYVAIAARRLLDSTEALENSQQIVMSVELLADQGLRTRSGASATGDALPGLPTSMQESAKFAEEFSRLGISVVLMGLSATGHLVRVTAKNGVLEPAIREDFEVFSKARLHEWSKRFPYGYGDVPEIDNLFYTSLRRLSLTIKESGRVLFVVGAELAQLPPNLLIVSDEFVGRTLPVAAAPSLAWLRSARSLLRSTSGERGAWVSTVSAAGKDSTLKMLAERLEPTLKAHAITIESGSDIPARLNGAELVIVAAHGGIVPEGRFFQVVANDADLRMTSATLSKALGGADLVILFVCSGGRLDRHPFANTTVGLAKDILNRGCATVIASPWPLHTSVPAYWLPEFLALWETGSSAIDANFKANKAVEKALGNFPARCLAMTVFGDPLLTKPN
jgi:tetratricopeptide (TPR) repeat protein